MRAAGHAATRAARARKKDGSQGPSFSKSAIAKSLAQAAAEVGALLQIMATGERTGFDRATLDAMTVAGLLRTSLDHYKHGLIVTRFHARGE